MRLDSNSRSILGCCVVAVVLLLTWFHGNGKGLDHGLSRCGTPAPVDGAPDCATCRPGAASRNAAVGIDDADQRAVGIGTPAPRS